MSNDNSGVGQSSQVFPLTGCLNSDGDIHEMEGYHPGPRQSFSQLLANFSHLSDLNLFNCRNLNSNGLETLAECCTSLEKLNIDEVRYLTDESVNRCESELCYSVA